MRPHRSKSASSISAPMSISHCSKPPSACSARCGRWRASAKFGLRAVAQSAARELGPKGIHVAHLIIDAGVDTAWVRERIKEREGEAALANLDPWSLMRPESVAEAYWQIYQEPRDGWSFEREVRPFAEKW